MNENIVLNNVHDPNEVGPNEVGPNEVGTNEVGTNEVVSSLERILDNETNNNKKETWSKLNKTTKIIKLNNYADKLGEQNEMSEADIQNFKKYLGRALERKRLISAKEVMYDNVEGEIVNIPCLIFSNRKFTLKRLEKRVSTLKSLGSGRSKNKLEKIEANILN